MIAVNSGFGDVLVEMTDVGLKFDGPEGPVWGVRGANLTLRPGELVAVLGASGSGKSTLLSLAGLLRFPTTGKVTFLGQEVDGLSERARDELRRDHVGFVFQHGALIEHLTLLQNVMVPMLARGRSAPIQRATELLTVVGLAEHAEKLPGEVSGGQAQRAAFCRAIIHDPEILLADEPTASLDPAAAAGVVALIRSFVADGGAALIATHDERVAGAADRVLDLTSSWVAQ